MPGCCAPSPLQLSGSVTHYCEDVCCSSVFNRVYCFCFTANVTALVWLPNFNKGLEHAQSPWTNWMVYWNEYNRRSIFASLVFPKSEAKVVRCYPIQFMTTCTHGSWTEQCIPNCSTQYLSGTSAHLGPFGRNLIFSISFSPIVFFFCFLTLQKLVINYILVQSCKYRLHFFI